MLQNFLNKVPFSISLTKLKYFDFFMFIMLNMGCDLMKSMTQTFSTSDFNLDKPKDSEYVPVFQMFLIMV